MTKLISMVVTVFTIIISTPTAATIQSKAEMCKRDIECRVLAEAGYYEARSEPDIGVVSVMYVIINRVKHKNWKNTIQGVVYQPKQFSYTHDGSLRRGMKEKEQVDRMLVYAYDVLHGNIESPVGGATHYHATYANPKRITWATKDAYVMHIGRHIFYS